MGEYSIGSMFMHMEHKAKAFIHNLIFAFAAQTLSLLLSLIMSLLVPKMLGVQEFGYWQLFLFYASYAGFFYLGLIDGIYLRHGGEQYKRLNFSLLGAQFRLSYLGLLLFSLCIGAYAVLLEHDPRRRFVLLATAVYLLVFDPTGFLGYVFQATNHTKKYSVSVMIDKAVFILLIIGLLALKAKQFEIYIILYLLSKVFALLYCMIVGRKIIFARPMTPAPVLAEMGINIKVGISLMLSNIADMLILGSGRFIVDHRWGIAAFGKFSFALSLTNFFLLFLSQVSMVLFPALRGTSGENLKKYYALLRDGLGLVLSAVFLLYLPIRYILGLWLPQYRESLMYLSLLMPLCIFEGKMDMLCTTYMKVLRKERMLLLINAVSFGVSILLGLIGAYLLGNIDAIILSMVLAIALRSVISELYVAKLMRHTGIVKSLGLECALALLFVMLTWFAGTMTAFFIYLAAYLAYLYLLRANVRNVTRAVRSIARR